MKKTALLWTLVFGLLTGSASAEAGWFGKAFGKGSLFGKIAVKPTMPAVTIPQEPCFHFAYTSENRSGIEDVFSGGNCLSEPKNLTSNSVAVPHSQLASGRATPDLAFIQDVPTEGGVDPTMSVMNLMNGRWNIFEAGAGFPEHFSPKAVAWDGAGRMAVISREKRACREGETCDENGETDGGFALRLNEGSAHHIGETNLVQPLGMVPPEGMDWVPVPGQARSRFLIVSFGNLRNAIVLYVFDMEAPEVRPVPLEAGAFEDRPIRAQFGAQPAVMNSGEDLLFVRHDRILGCRLDVSHMDDRRPRAFCTDAREPQRLRLIEDAEMASPAVSQDGEWLFFAMKTPYSTSWDLYRSSLTRLFLTPLTITPSVDEKEIVSVPGWLEITGRPSHATAGTVREEPQYMAAPISQPVQTIVP